MEYLHSSKINTSQQIEAMIFSEHTIHDATTKSSYFVDPVNINFYRFYSVERCEYTLHQDERLVGLSLTRSHARFHSLQNNDGCIKMKYYTLAWLVFFYGFQCK